MNTAAHTGSNTAYGA